MESLTSARPEITEELREELHHLYQALHAAPELSMQEHRTAELIEQRMEGLGCEVFRCGGTGVVAVLRNGDGPVVGFRADIDALPIVEETGLPYASTAKGEIRDGTEVPVMHACGHDTHITCAIGAASLLVDTRDQWRGTVVFLFQPGEETSEGARAMVEDGLWDRAPQPQVIYGQHVWPTRAGTLEVSSGPAMAMADSWRVTVHGRGGHGSRPEETIDPVVLAAHMVVRIQSIVSREVGPKSASVITIASFHAGQKENIIPARAEFTVNVRNLDPTVREHVLAALRRVIRAEAQASGASEPEIEEMYTFPLLYNDPEATDRLRQALAEAIGPDKVLDTSPQMGSEDFGLLAEALGVPAVYWFFGGMPDEVVDGDEPVPTNHSAFFAPVMEPTLSTGVAAAFGAVMSQVATGEPRVGA